MDKTEKWGFMMPRCSIANAGMSGDTATVEEVIRFLETAGLRFADKGQNLGVKCHPDADGNFSSLTIEALP